MIKLSRETLKIILDRFINKTKSENKEYFIFDDDFYWCVPEDRLIDMEKSPDLIVGSLKDDVDFLNSLVIEDYDTNYLDLERLSAVFKYLSLKLSL